MNHARRSFDSANTHLVGPSKTVEIRENIEGGGIWMEISLLLPSVHIRTYRRKNRRSRFKHCYYPENLLRYTDSVS